MKEIVDSIAKELEEVFRMAPENIAIENNEIYITFDLEEDPILSDDIEEVMEIADRYNCDLSYTIIADSRCDGGVEQHLLIEFIFTPRSEEG
jgi:uncharacterized protein (UPF0276 family)